MKLEVREIDEKWGLFLGETLIGTSKARFDADHAREVLSNWRPETAQPEPRTTYGNLKPQ